MPKIKTFEDACKALKLDPKKALSNIPKIPGKHQKGLIAAAKLYIIADALNGGWEPDWSNYNEYKYYPWFNMRPSGFGLFRVFCSHSHSGVGSRLCFKSEEIAEYAAKTFLDLYKILFNF
jgi:hypothetical protein